MQSSGHPNKVCNIFIPFESEGYGFETLNYMPKVITKVVKPEFKPRQCDFKAQVLPMMYHLRS